MIPCLYLSDKGTNIFKKSENKQAMIEKLRESLLLGENTLVLRLALNTSSILLKKDYFFEIGMFSDDFKGHGGEDFELLHRLATLNPHSKKEDDYYIDEVNQFPYEYKGFRKYLIVYSLPYLFTNLLVVHLWHSRPLFNKFYFNRIKNETLLLDKMKKFDELNYFKNNVLWNVEKDFIDVKLMMNVLLKENGYIDEKFIGLKRYSNKVIIVKNPIGNKIRKLITRPRQFFIDMIKNRYK